MWRCLAFALGCLEEVAIGVPKIQVVRERFFVSTFFRYCSLDRIDLSKKEQKRKREKEREREREKRKKRRWKKLLTLSTDIERILKGKRKGKMAKKTGIRLLCTPTKKILFSKGTGEEK